MVDNKKDVFHKFKNNILRLQSIVELLLFERIDTIPEINMLEDGDKTIENIKTQWEKIKKKLPEYSEL